MRRRVNAVRLKHRLISELEREFQLWWDDADEDLPMSPEFRSGYVQGLDRR